jgi:hypothetical protein
VDLEFFWDGGVQPAQEREKLLVAVAGLAFGSSTGKPQVLAIPISPPDC